MNRDTCLPELIRVSAGSAAVLGLLEVRMDAAPTTVYMMTYRREKCNANCGFCPQARGSRSRTDMLSRISWPTYTTEKVLEKMDGAFKKGQIERVCIQALNYPEVFDELLALIVAIHKLTQMPISVSCQPTKREDLVKLAEAGVQRIGIPLDAATEEVFNKIKGPDAGGPYRWEKQLQLLEDATEVFGKRGVSTHLIVGIGETERQMIRTIQHCVDMGVLPGLFAFTPVPGTALAHRRPPHVAQFRRIQVARYLILCGIARCENMEFEKDCLIGFGVDRQTLKRIIETGKPFLTSGCPSCNRPYYNERSSGPIYNYPRPLKDSEILEIKNELDRDTKRIQDN